MAVNNVFQMLAQQEIDRPARRLQDLQIQQQEAQLKNAIKEQEFQQGLQSALSAKGPSLSNMGPQASGYSPQAPDLASIISGQPQQAQMKPPTLVQQLTKTAEYYANNGRPLEAKKIYDELVNTTSKVDAQIKALYSQGGKPAVDNFFAQAPHFKELVGEPVFRNQEVLYNYSNPDGTPSDRQYRFDANGNHVDVAPLKADPEAMLDKRFTNQQKLQAQQIAAQDRRTAQQIEAADRRAASDRSAAERRAAGKTDPADAIVAREVVKDLPKLRREARTAEASKPRLAQMISLLDSGAGGLKGNALAAISGVFDTPATSEAELFKKLAAAGAGQLRTSVIGPGAVSNYEQSLLQAISGGGNGARTATRQLLKFYEQEADRTINNYNDAVDSAVTVAPKAVKGFGKIGGGTGAKSKGKADPLGIL